MAGFDDVAVCARALAEGLAGAPLYVALATGREWPGLAEAGEAGGSLRVFRIDYGALR